MPFQHNCSMIVLANAPVAQRIEQWPPEPCEEVRLFSGALFYEWSKNMHYHIYCNTKTMHSNHFLAIEEFKKRLSAYCETTLHTDTTLFFPKDITTHNHHFIYIKKGLSSYSSEQFSDCVNQLQLSGKSTIHVVIGFDEVTFYDALGHVTSYDTPLSLSLTNSNLSNETKTLLFYEQLYRGYTILQGKTYHK